jgi:hypothetical protein
MKIVFKGYVEKGRKGCPVCGKRRSEYVYRSRRPYILPSGITKTFRAGIPVEVSPSDGEFLLSVTYEAQGEIKHAFEVA